MVQLSAIVGLEVFGKQEAAFISICTYIQTRYSWLYQRNGWMDWRERSGNVHNRGGRVNPAKWL